MTSPSRGPGRKRLHVASFPHHATIIAEATCPAVPGCWTLGLGPLLGWTSIGAVWGSHPVTPLTPGVTASLEPGAGGQQSPEQTSSLLDSMDLGQRCPGWATVTPGALLGKGPGSSGRSWTRTHAVPMRGCPQPHQDAGLGGCCVGGRAGGSGAAPSTACRWPPLLICLDHGSGQRVPWASPPTIKSRSITEANAVTLGSQMLSLQTLLINRGETRELDERG